MIDHESTIVTSRGWEHGNSLYTLLSTCAMFEIFRTEIFLKKCDSRNTTNGNKENEDSEVKPPSPAQGLGI